MKTLRTIATVVLAAFLVLGPAMAFAAGETVTVKTDATSYQGNATIQVSGTVTPPPTSTSTAVVVTTKGPNGAAVDVGTAQVATDGSYQYTIAAGSSLWVNSGTYTVNATYGGPGGTGSQTTTFQYTPTGIGGGSTTTVTVTTTLSTATITTTIPSSDAAQLTSIQNTLNGIQSSLNTLTTGFGTINSGINALSGVPASLNTVSQGVSGIQSTLTGISGNIQTVNGIGAQLTSLTNAVNNNQTYVLVVAALAAITLVLELAILVRKLS